MQNEIKARETDRDNFQAQLEKLENDARNERNDLQNQLDKERDERINQAKEMDDYFRYIQNAKYFFNTTFLLHIIFMFKDIQFHIRFILKLEMKMKTEKQIWTK